MDMLPRDLWQVIASFMVDTTKRQMRLASTAWFYIIKYSKFEFYCTSSEDVPVITERLSKYNWPIELIFSKSKINEPRHLIIQLPKLTNLRSIKANLGIQQVEY